MLLLVIVTTVWGNAQGELDNDIPTALGGALESYNAAILCHTSGSSSCALAHYLRALAIKPDFHQAHQNVGILYESGDCNDASGSLTQSYKLARHHHRLAVKHSPSIDFSAGAWCNLIGLELRLMTFPGQLQEAQYETEMSDGEHIIISSKNDRLVYFAEQLQGILRQLPDAADANVLFTLAKVHLEMQDYEKSLEIFKRLLVTYPTHSMALLNVGNHYFRCNDFERASDFYAQSVAVLLSRHEAAETRSVENLVMALNNLGQSLRQMGRLDEAILTIEKALQIMRSGDVGAEDPRRSIDKGLELWSMNNVFAMRGLANHWGVNYESAEIFLEEAVRLQGLNPLEYIAPSLSNGIVDPYTFSLQRFASRRSDLETNRIYCLPFSAPSEETRVSSSMGTWKPGTQSRTIKLGYLSYDWRDHPMGRLTQRFVTSHNRSRISSISISYGPDDKSSVRSHVQANSQNFLDIEIIRNDYDASDRVRMLDLDVVIDLTSHTYNGRIAIAALKPAPLVINYLGYPGTTGCTGFDYSMVDKGVVPPEFARDLFSERLIYLPYSYQANSMPLTVPLCLSKDRKHCRYRMIETKAPYYSGTTSFQSWGSPDNIWLCSFNANKKIEPIAFAAWMNIMRENPRTILILIDLEDAKRKKIYLQGLYHGLSTSRIIFIPTLPWRDHLYRSASCDLILDTFVYGAHTTSSDALWMSVPLLVLESWGTNRMPSRVAASITSSVYSAYSQKSSISVTHSIKDYETMGRRILKRDQMQQFTYVFHGQIAAATLRASTFGAAYMQESIEYAIQGTMSLHELRKVVPTGLGRLHHMLFPPQQSAHLDEKLHQLKTDALKQIGDCVTLRNFMKKTAIQLESTQFRQEADIHAIAGRLLAGFPDVSIASTLHHLFSVFSGDAPQYSCSALGTEFLDTLLRSDPFLKLDKLEKCLLTQPRLTITTLLQIQFEHAGLCDDEDIIFRGISPMLIVNTAFMLNPTYVIHLMPLFSVLPHLFNVSSIGWISLSPVLVLADASGINPLIAMILSNHAVCAINTGAAETAAILLASSFVFDPVSKRLMDIGLIVDSFNPELGYIVASSASLLMHTERFSQYALSHPKALRPEGSQIRIVFYCYEYGNEWWGNWGPSSLEKDGKGVGGSEESVIYLSEELASLGHDVTVFADPPENDKAQDTVYGVHYRHHTEFDVSDPIDVFISWRYSYSLALGRNAKLSILWLHDLVSDKMLPPPATEKFEAILVQSSFHMERIAEAMRQRGYDDKANQRILQVLPNGISFRRGEELMRSQGTNDRRTFIYGSSPTRGLENLLKVWPLIHASIPDSQLKVFYGYPASVKHQYRKQMGVERFEKWYTYMMDVLLRQAGVVYVGAVDHQTLTREYASAGFILYPTRFSETGCITLMKAMSCGAIPITSRYAYSVLPNLTSTYDLGPHQALQQDIDFDEWLVDQFVPAVVKASKIDDDELYRHRVDMGRHIREHYTWAASADRFQRNFLNTLFIR